MAKAGDRYEVVTGNIWGYAHRGDITGVKTALARGVDVNLTNTVGWTALHAAAAGILYTIPVLKCCVHLPHEVNSFVTRRSAGGHVKIVGLLLNKGADVNNIRDRGGNLPIHEACLGGHASVVQALVHAGSSLEAVRLSQTKGAEVRALVVAAMRAANKDEEAPAPVGYARKQVKSNAFFGAKIFLMHARAQSAVPTRKDDCIEPGIALSARLKIDGV
jgi:hypothetical protein